MQAILNIAIRAARKAGAYIVRERERLDQQTTEAQIVTVQANAQLLIQEIIEKAYPDHSIVGDHLPYPEQLKETVWHLEVVSGIDNLLRNIPHYALVFSIEENEKIKYCLICDPHTNEIYTAGVGTGAQYNTYKIRVNHRHALQGAVLATSTLQAGQLKQASNLAALNEQGVTLYNQGCSALSLAYVAAGRVDAFFGQALSKTVMQAAILLMKETGGLVSDFQGGLEHVAKAELLASNPKLFKVLLKELKD